MISILILYLFIGVFVGTLAGLFGIGGGVLLIPTIMFSLQQMGASEEIVMHMTLGTSLSCILITAIVSTYTHYQDSNIDFKILKKLVLGIILGAISGGLIAANLSTMTLKIFFAVFLTLICFKMFSSYKIEVKEKKIPLITYLLVGAIIGIKSSILGIGGGTITVPFLSWSGLNMKKAVGISAAVGIPIAIFGAGTYMFKGLNNPLLPEYSLGYIYLPAFFGIITTSSIFSKMGTKLSQKIPQDKLYRYFALFILIMLLKTYYSLFN